MLALIYLVVMVFVGDLICRRFYDFVSLPHRLGAAFIVGLVSSTWFTYLAAWTFSSTTQPLLWGNLLFFVIAFAFIYWSIKRAPKIESIHDESTKAEKWDWVVIGIFLVVAVWEMFSSFGIKNGKMQIANHQSSDFGLTVSIMQSFALGHNFPTELPHFSGERIYYHFLFYFQAGNLEYLGFSPTWSYNILSILGLVSMLMLVMTLGIVLFRSRIVGRIGAALFFFHGTLSFIPFILSHQSVGDMLSAAINGRDFLQSGFPYRGELWGVWSQAVFLNQRHLSTAIGLLLLILIFLISRYRTALSLEEASKITENYQIPDQSEEIIEDENSQLYDGSEVDIEEENDQISQYSEENIVDENNQTEEQIEEESSEIPQYPEVFDETEVHDSNSDSLNGTIKSVAPFVFSGILLGLLPMFNSAVFMAAFVVLAFLFILFPLKKQLLWLALSTAIVALPQVIFLKTGNIRPADYSLFHWGFTVEDAGFFNVIKYLGFTFGFKWLLIALALFLATRLQRRVFIAVSSLIVVAFCFRFSVEVLANHKFLNLWLIIANLFVAFSLWSLWNMTLLKSAFLGKLLAGVLTALIMIGGIIDFFPIYNSYWVEIPYENDELVNWVSQQTDPKAVFLTPRFVNHGILLAGRQVFYGHSYYAWSAGYQAAERDVAYKRLFEERNPQKLLRLLHANNISYVAIDDALKKDDLIKNLNEEVYKNNFEKVFQDPDNIYGGLMIFKVPPKTADEDTSDLAETDVDTNTPSVNAFEGGQGQGQYQFNKPRGIATDTSGNIYVADWGNSRIQKFSPTGEFLQTIGKQGTGAGELREANGIAVDAAGNMYVAEALNHRIIKYKPDGSFEKEWIGPDPGFYGPRDVAIGPDKNLYILDQGRSRVVKFNPESEEFSEFGQKGTGDGEFNDPTGIAVGKDFVFVTDAGNNRVQVFDLEGKFIRQWEIPQWEKYLWHYPDAAFDDQTNRLYVTSGWSNEILVFDADGKRLDALNPTESVTLDNPSSLVIAETKNERRLYVLNTGGARVSVYELGKTQKTK